MKVKTIKRIPPTIQTDAIQNDAIQTDTIPNLYGVVYTRKNDAIQTKYFFQPSLYIVVFFHDSDDMQTGGMLFGKQRKQFIMKLLCQ